MKKEEARNIDSIRLSGCRIKMIDFISFFLWFGIAASVLIFVDKATGLILSGMDTYYSHQTKPHFFNIMTNSASTLDIRILILLLKDENNYL